MQFAELTRRRFLRSTGVALALPLLNGLLPRARANEEQEEIRRMVCICAPLGLHTPHLYPQSDGRDYELTPYLEVVKDFRDDFTLISGLSHPGVDFGHDSIFSFLTGAPHPETRAGFVNSISLDQLAADSLSERTRFPSLVLSSEGFTLSWTRSGAPVPSEVSPSRVFAKLFLQGEPDEVQAEILRLRDGQSILDRVTEQAKGMQAELGSDDREKLDEYFTSVRELERRMSASEQWAKKPKPQVNVEQPQDITDPADLIGRTRLLFDLTHLALQTDSTRVVTILLLGTSLVPPIAGVSDGHHNLSHHGQDETKLEQLKRIELETLGVFRDLLAKLKASREGSATLLDRTMVYFSSNLGNASSHSCKDLPVLLAGGGFQHGQYLRFDPASPPPLCNLYVSMLQRLGLEYDSFGSSLSSLTGV